MIALLNDQRLRTLILSGVLGTAGASLMALQARGQSVANRYSEALNMGGPMPSTAIQSPGNADPNEVFNRWEPVPILFPAHPPPLGVSLNAPIENHPAGPVMEQLFGEMLEPYFPQLTSRLLDMHEHVTRNHAERLSEYRRERERLLSELRKAIKSTAELDAAERLTAFSELARSQAPALREQEKRAESLRRMLQSGVSWYELRRWQLGAGSLDVSREQLESFEYQVIRATAYYRNGLSPSQRRVLLESLQLMDSETTDGKAAGGFVFFSPDMMLVRFPDDLPENLAERVRAFVELKNTKRTQLRDAAYLADFPRSGYSRKKALRRFVTETEGQLEALEDTAEQIRIELMPTRDSWRRSPPVELPAELLAAIDEYVLGKREMSDLQIQAMRSVKPEPMPANAYDNPEQLADWRKDYMDRMALAKQDILRENAATIAELDAILDRIEEMLAPYLMRGDEVVGMHAADGLLMKFLKRYREQTAFYEYDIAAFEPGLSLAQRNLLFAGAVARLQLTVAGPEMQPEYAPQTLVSAR